MANVKKKSSRINVLMAVNTKLWLSGKWHHVLEIAYYLLANYKARHPRRT